MLTIAQKKQEGVNMHDKTFENGTIDMSHGAGGRAMEHLIDQIFIKTFGGDELSSKNDGARLQLPAGEVVISTDSFVITPLFFPGGDIGSLSVHGTCNDVAVSGAKPLYLTSSFIIEEGFAIRDLKRIVESMAAAAREIGVTIVTGDTKVVERGQADGLFINTTGIGVVTDSKIRPRAESVNVGDKIIVNGYIGDHGIAVLSQREGFEFGSKVLSDSASLSGLIQTVLNEVSNVSCMRDATRGGVAAVLHEIARASQIGMVIDEKEIPVREEVRSVCEFLGMDPLYIANEGKVVMFVPENEAQKALEIMKKHPLGMDARVIGTVLNKGEPEVVLKTLLGSQRVVYYLNGEPLPRIC
jgi:hydrogenase expression/formation protein HypE